MSKTNPHQRQRPKRRDETQPQIGRPDDSSSSDSDCTADSRASNVKRSSQHRRGAHANCQRSFSMTNNQPDGPPPPSEPQPFAAKFHPRPSNSPQFTTNHHLQRRNSNDSTSSTFNGDAAGRHTFVASSPPPPPHPELTLAQLGFESTRVANWSGIQQPIKTDLFELLRQMILGFEKTNVRISIGDASFNCHMLVLQCYSAFFMELQHEQHVILPADKVTPYAFQRVYEWMLSTEPQVQREGILELFNAAQYLRIKGLVAQCWVCLDDDERFSEDAAFMLYLEARAIGHGDELIQRLMLNRVGKFFLTLVASKEFVEFDVEEVCRLLMSNSIATNAETEVLMAAIRWLDWRWDERRDDLLAVMRCVRFGLMTPWQLVELKRNVDVQEIRRFVECAGVQKMVDDAMSYVTTKYWYAASADTVQHYMERLQYTEPVDRQWIHDPLWYDNYEEKNQMFVSYASFLDYLAKIRLQAGDHWRSLKFCDTNPHAIDSLQSTADGAIRRLTSSVWNGVSGEGWHAHCADGGGGGVGKRGVEKAHASGEDEVVVERVVQETALGKLRLIDEEDDTAGGV